MEENKKLNKKEINKNSKLPFDLYFDKIINIINNNNKNNTYKYDNIKNKLKNKYDIDIDFDELNNAIEGFEIIKKKEDQKLLIEYGKICYAKIFSEKNRSYKKNPYEWCIYSFFKSSPEEFSECGVGIPLYFFYFKFAIFVLFITTLIAAIPMIIMSEHYTRGLETICKKFDEKIQIYMKITKIFQIYVKKKILIGHFDFVWIILKITEKYLY